MFTTDERQLREWWDISFDEIEEGQKRSVVAGAGAGNTRSRCEAGDGRGCAAGLVSFRWHRLVSHRRDDEAPQQRPADPTYTVGIEAKTCVTTSFLTMWCGRGGLMNICETDYHEIMLQPEWPSCCRSSSITWTSRRSTWRFRVIWFRKLRAKR